MPIANGYSSIIVLGMAFSGAGLGRHENRGINQQYACVTNRISMLADYIWLLSYSSSRNEIAAMARGGPPRSAS